MRCSSLRQAWVLAPAWALVTLLLAGAARADAQPVAFEFLRYEAHIAILTDGAVEVTEQLDVALSAGTPGITRVLRYREPLDAGRERIYPVEDLDVSGERGQVTYILDERESDLAIEVRDGLAGEPRRNRFTLRYRQEGVLDAVDGTARLTWSPALLDFTAPTQGVTVTVTAPAAILAATCGDETTAAACAAIAVDGAVARMEDAAPGPRPPALVVTFAQAARPIVYERQSLGRAFSVTPASLTGTGVLALILAAMLGPSMLALARDVRHRGSPRRAAVEVTPPDGVRPAEIVALRCEGAVGLALAIAIVDLAERGHLRIEETIEAGERLSARSHWRLVRMDGDTGTLAPYERQLLDTLFMTGTAGTTDLAAVRRDAATVRAASATLAASMAARGWTHADATRARLRRAVAGGALATTGTLTLFAAIQFTEQALAPVPVVAAGAALLLTQRLVSHRTARGTSMLIRVAGYEQGMRDAGAGGAAAPVAYAMALGVLDAWGEHAGRAGVTAPAWYVARMPATAAGFADAIRLFEAGCRQAVES